MRWKNKLRMMLVMLLMITFPTMNTTKNEVDNPPEKKYAYNLMTESYSYDGFLDYVIQNAWMHTSDNDVYFYGTTSSDYGGIEFYCSFDLASLEFRNTYWWYSCGVIDESIQGYVNKNGGVGAILEYYNTDSEENETYNIDDYKNPYELEKFVYQVEDDDEEEEIMDASLFIEYTFSKIAALVSIYVIVAETAEQIQSEKNYVHNRALELCDDGVYYGHMIANQSERNRDGYNSGDYKLGFADFADVGCEVASVYNLLVKIDKFEYLSEVIYEFEKWMIEFSVGWGNLGCNPREIEDFLANKHISYETRKATGYGLKHPDYDFACFKKMVNDYILYEHFIISFWNDPMTDGIHTYYFERLYEKDYDFKSYNRHYYLGIENITEADNLLEGDEKFIVGYLIL